MNAPITNYPPEISGLIRRYGSVTAAEEAVHVRHGTFHQIRNNKIPYDYSLEQVVKAAIRTFDFNKESKKMPRHELVIPESCPPLLADILREKQSKQAVRAIVKCGEKTMNGVIAGEHPMPTDWEVKIKAELGQQVIPLLEASRAAPQASAEASAPDFVVWDGKTKGTVEIAAWGKAKGRKIKNVPQPIVDLIAKYGKVAAAAQAMGMTGGALMNWMDQQKPFTHERQQRVYAAMHGMPSSGGANELGQSLDKYALGLAICMLKAPAYDRVNEIAAILNGRLVFRKNTSGGWIIIYRMAQAEDLMRFKKLAMRDASEIVCP